MKNKFAIFIVTLFFAGLAIFGCNSKQKKSPSPQNETLVISGDTLLDLVQYQTFQYFWDGAEPTSGMARERIHMDGIYPQNDQDVITLGGSGFGVMAILVGIEHGFITREQALQRYQKIVAYLDKATRVPGAWAPLLYGPTSI